MVYANSMQSKLWMSQSGDDSLCITHLIDGQFGTYPATFAYALRRPDAQRWINAMREELQSIEDNNTWILCDLPPGRKYIGTK